MAGAGVDFLQVREKDLPRAELREVVRALRGAVPPGARPRLVMNVGHQELSAEEVVELAVEAGLDGVHLPAGMEMGLSMRRRVGVVSAAVHRVDEVAGAVATGAEMLLFGPVFGKVVRGDLVRGAAGLEMLAEVVRRAGTTRVLALGGVTAERVGECLAAGAAGVASIRMFLPGAGGRGGQDQG